MRYRRASAPWRRKLSTDTMCAELTNHLIPGVVLNPGAVGTLVELAKAGFAYAR
jgi:hypothetical protein